MSQGQHEPYFIIDMRPLQAGSEAMTQQIFSDSVAVQGSQDVTQLVVKGNSTQTQPLQTWMDNAGNLQAQVTGDGRLQIGNNLGVGAPADALIQANNDLTLPSALPPSGWHTLGRLTGALSNTITWVIHELQLLGTGGVSSLQTAMRAKLTHSNTGNSTGAELRAVDAQTVNQGGTIGAPVGQASGLRATVSNAAGAYLAKAVGVEAALTNDSGGTVTQAAAFAVVPPVNNAGTIATLTGLQIPDLTAGQNNYAIQTGLGAVSLGDDVTIAGTADVGAFRLAAGANDGYVLTSDASGNATWQAGGGGGSPLTIEEQDGAPSVANVTKIKVMNGTLTDNGGGVVSIQTGAGTTMSALPVGSMMAWGATNPPEGWLICDGSNINRTTYADLFNAIGTTYGIGDGSTTFTLPDFRGRTPVGVGRMDGTGTDRVLGAEGGEETHALTTAELAAHNHQQQSENNTRTVNPSYHGSGSGAVNYNTNYYGAATSVASTTPLTTVDTGAGTAHNNMPPYLVVTVIIRYSKLADPAATGVPMTVTDGDSVTVAGCDTLIFPDGSIIDQGDGSVTFGPNMMATVTPQTKNYQQRTILFNTVLSGGQTSVDVQNIDQTYDFLEIHIAARTSSNLSYAWGYIWFNNDTTGGNYDQEHIASASGVAQAAYNNAPNGFFVPGNTSSANEFGSNNGVILDYAKTDKFKTWQAHLSEHATIDSGSNSYNFLNVMTWQNTAAINRITFSLAGSAAFAAGSHIQIVGVKQEAVLTGLTVSGTLAPIVNKGDLAVGTGTGAQNLPVGADGTVLTADSSQSDGVKWANAMPCGAVTQYAGSSAPTGWLICDGSAVSRTTYAALFAAISTAFGAGDGSTTFNLPDARGRTPVGVGVGSGLTNRVLAATGGEETHVLTVAELAAHHHTPRRASATGGGTTPNISGDYYTATPVTMLLDTTDTGSGTAHNNMQPWLALNYIIKT